MSNSLLAKIIGAISGGHRTKISEQLLYDKVIGVKGIVPGVGTSTIVQNIAIGISENTNYTVCVLDMNCLYPTQYSLLVKAEEMYNQDTNKKDLLSFTDDISEITHTTSYRNVYLAGFTNRTVLNMLSTQDSEARINKIIGALKSFFDVILIDLSYELTNMNVYAGIKCNKIINVVDQSIKSTVNLKKSLNTMATLGVPLSKANRIVINKVAPDLVADTEGLMESAGLEVLGKIHFNLDILKAGVSGKRVYSKNTTNTDMDEFSGVIDSILDYILQVTPKNEKYLKTDSVKDEEKTPSSGVYEEEVEFEEEVVSVQDVNKPKLTEEEDEEIHL